MQEFWIKQEKRKEFLDRISVGELLPRGYGNLIIEEYCKLHPEVPQRQAEQLVRNVLAYKSTNDEILDIVEDKYIELIIKVLQNISNSASLKQKLSAKGIKEDLIRAMENLNKYL